MRIYAIIGSGLGLFMGLSILSPVDAASISPLQLAAGKQFDAGFVHDVGRKYNRRRHGPRFRYRRGPYRHFHGGFYYRTPWWTLPLAIPGVVGGYSNGSAHVQYCLDKYRSYDPRTNTYLGYDGERHPCRSPY
jgi:hypothetical protein